MKCSALNIDFNGARFDPLGSRNQPVLQESNLSHFAAPRSTIIRDQIYAGNTTRKLFNHDQDSFGISVNIL